MNKRHEQRYNSAKKHITEARVRDAERNALVQLGLVKEPAISDPNFQEWVAKTKHILGLRQSENLGTYGGVSL